MYSALNSKTSYFAHNTDVGIIGRGASMEAAFADAAKAMFMLMADISKIHLKQIITFEFAEEDPKLAFITWLNLLLTKAHEHHLVCSDFRLKRNGKYWQATVSGEAWHSSIKQGIGLKGVTATLLSLKKIDHQWEARCVVKV